MAAAIGTVTTGSGITRGGEPWTDVTHTQKDRALLAEFCARAYDADAIKPMKID